MHEVEIGSFVDNTRVTFSTYEDITSGSDHSYYDDGLFSLYGKFYQVARILSSLLKITLPDIALGSRVISINEKSGELSLMDSIMYTPEDFPVLKNNLIYLGIFENAMIPHEPQKEFNSGEVLKLCGILAHELRHIWQRKYHKQQFIKGANGMAESLHDEWEIDADAFAIASLVVYADMSYEEAGEAVCPEEKRIYPDAYKERIDRVSKYVSDIKENFRKKTLKERILDFFRRK